VQDSATLVAAQKEKRIINVHSVTGSAEANKIQQAKLTRQARTAANGGRQPKQYHCYLCNRPYDALFEAITCWQDHVKDKRYQCEGLIWDLYDDTLAIGCIKVYVYRHVSMS
jgi:hypothetical protein